MINGLPRGTAIQYPKQKDIPPSPPLEIKHSYNLKILHQRVREAIAKQKELLTNKTKSHEHKSKNSD
jgi:hypothetical protein